jgi:hypothetical protein
MMHDFFFIELSVRSRHEREERERERAKEENGSTPTLVVKEWIYITSTPLFALTLISLSHMQ